MGWMDVWIFLLVSEIPFLSVVCFLLYMLDTQLSTLLIHLLCFFGFLCLYLCGWNGNEGDIS